MTTIKGIVAFALALAPMLAAADTVYKYQRPDGKVVYSDVPLRGAKLIGRFELVPVPPPQGGARGDRSQQSEDLAGERAEQHARRSMPPTRKSRRRNRRSKTPRSAGNRPLNRSSANA